VPAAAHGHTGALQPLEQASLEQRAGTTLLTGRVPPALVGASMTVTVRIGTSFTLRSRTMLERRVEIAICSPVLTADANRVHQAARGTAARAIWSTNWPVICLVATFTRLYALIVAIATTSAASCGSL
jgi:hypothetical protein